MRTFIRLLLCLALAFQGIAHAYAVKTPCPMEQAGQVMAMDAADMAGNCCNDAETAAKTGKLCKTGQECNLAQSCLPASSAQSTQGSALSCFVPAIGHVVVSFAPPDVWRPPTFN